MAFNLFFVEIIIGLQEVTKNVQEGLIESSSSPLNGNILYNYNIINPEIDTGKIHKAYLYFTTFTCSHLHIWVYACVCSSM